MKLIVVRWAAVLLVTIFLSQVRAELSEVEARAHLKRGALVVDVRTVGEFQAGHLTNAVNIPLAELKTKLPGVATNQAAVILLHCQSGQRSRIAERELRALGYTNAFNIGSLKQARKIQITPEPK
jgi:phage shock protein E